MISNLKKAGIGGGLALVVAVGLIATSGQMIPQGNVFPQLVNNGGTFLTGEQASAVTGSQTLAVSAQVSLIRWTGASDVTWTNWTGFQPGALVLFKNASTTSNAVFKHDNASTAGDFYSPGSVDLTCGPRSRTWIIYDSTSARWLPVGGNGCWSSKQPVAQSVCAAGERPEWDGSAWQCRISVGNDYRSTHVEWGEELLSSTNTETFACAGTGTGATCSTVTTGAGGTGARPGLLTLDVGTTTTGAMGRRTTSVVYPGDWATTTYDATWAPLTLSTAVEEYTVFSGIFGGINTSTQTVGCFLVYDRGNVMPGGINSGNTTNPTAVAANGGTRTRVLLNGTSQDGTTGGAGAIATCTATVGALTLPNTGWHTYKVVENGTSSCQFYFDGSLCTTLTTNIPAATTSNLFAGTFALKSAGTTSRIVYLDRHRLAVDMPAVRSP